MGADVSGGELVPLGIENAKGGDVGCGLSVEIGGVEREGSGGREWEMEVVEDVGFSGEGRRRRHRMRGFFCRWW